ncbi:MAG: YbaB/EbfC family nucleoid-associated protein [Deltaproteobacteria bacterium CG_4_8_14_3_um_filter_51_11]|nr:YbaB/EbfC family nucleoid-associated protein [bacterium]OIP37714.1 MAG: YbaB/EbfC family nucleoid-associated protein [Desulfobacteraceae bacterium CG2_30_51_40]PIP45707.1 MAG: YbaB/EbfC family nucleoid-associated protein [Deltaproteobacteria bacterium CG23_combo_of_CG06-09_8_20_14_all_51_20]PIX19977.1 MAG: YbaB/EbfC family nucleoid-associated protein [Deltaproteobacteria bacterium CG_4_8_14_3_um_filter_51_11]PIY23625.1 MAG: YbaB/EbfC family nucleoid-associated protein [Deltaproteobacteria ba
MKGIPNMGQLLKQAQAFQGKMAKVQEEMGQKTIEATAGGSMVTAVVNGNQELLSIRIDPVVIDPSDPEMLQDLVVAAVNDAMSRAKAMVNEEMGKLTKGISIPGLPNLF